MKLYQEILAQEFVNSLSVDLKDDLEKIVEMKCYQALEEIKKVLDDETLDDPECFHKIEKIVCIFEEMGSDGGSRHDFG